MNRTGQNRTEQSFSFNAEIEVEKLSEKEAKMSATMKKNEEETTRKPEAKPGSTHVNIKVNGQDGSEVFFRVFRRTQLRKLMKVYCERQGLEPRIIAFLLDGHLITGKQTADELGLVDGDEIDAMKHHGGGGGGDSGGAKWVFHFCEKW